MVLEKINLIKSSTSQNQMLRPVKKDLRRYKKAVAS